MNRWYLFVLLICQLTCIDLGEKKEGQYKFLNPAQTIASVDGKKIELKEFYYKLSQYKNLKYTDGKGFMKIKRLILEELIEDEIIAKEADRLDIRVKEDEIGQVLNSIQADYPKFEFLKILIHRGLYFNILRKLIKSEIAYHKVFQSITKHINVDEQDIQDYYKLNIDRYRVNESARVSQILVKTQEAAKLVLDILSKDKETDFSKLAYAFSVGAERFKGGDMGYIEKGTLPEEIDQQIFKLKKGEISRVVRSLLGFHILKVSDIKDAKVYQYSEVYESIKKRLLEDNQKKFFHKYLEKTKKDLDIRRNLYVLKYVTI